MPSQEDPGSPKERRTRAELARIGFENEEYVDYAVSPVFRAAFADMGLTAALPDGYPLRPPPKWEPLPILIVNETEWLAQEAEMMRLIEQGQTSNRPDSNEPPTAAAPAVAPPTPPKGPRPAPAPPKPQGEPPTTAQWRPM